ncbi:unnamed protein product [Scytosiphon promiscuus]
MKRCSYTSCQKYPSFNAEGNKKARYCKQHAETGMVNVASRRCLHDSCVTRPAFKALYTWFLHDTSFLQHQWQQDSEILQEHADTGMVNVRCRRCSHDSCMMLASFNVAGINKPAYSKQHAHGGMVRVGDGRC